MNKKFLSAILFGALMVSSTGTFVSCKDYDDDIKNLQEQIDKKAALTDLTTQVSAMQAALDAAKTSATDALAKAEEAKKAAEATGSDITDIQKTIDSLMTKIKSLEDATIDVEALKAELKQTIADSIKDADIDGLKKKVEDQLTVVKSLAGGYLTMVTEIDLWYKGGQDANLNPIVLNFSNVTEQDNKFGPKDEITFTKGKDVPTDAEVIVRVVPANAELTPEMISLINGLGEDITDQVTTTSVERYSELLTKSRATTETGLWKVKFNLPKYDKDAFAKIAEKDAKDILYALAVNDITVDATETEAAVAHTAVSDYAVTLNYAQGKSAAMLNFAVNGTEVADIHNRYAHAGEADGITTPSTSTIEDYIWSGDAATAINGDKTNVTAKSGQTKGNDDRQDQPSLNVEVGKAFSVEILSTDVDGTKVTPRAFYVTLDRTHAVESNPSEINAWESYKVEGLNTLVDKASKLSLTIPADAAKGDYIGFRVYAVNYDGTLVDPDGRAFYVYVAEQTTSATASVMFKPDTHLDENGVWTSDKGAITATGWTAATEAKLVKIYDSADSKKTDINSKLGNLTLEDNFVLYKGNAEKTFAAAADETNRTELAKYTKIAIKDVVMNKLEDGKTYVAVINMINASANNTVVETVTVSFTKVLPTFPTSVEPFTNVLVDNTLKIYPKNFADDAKTTAIYDIDNVWHGVDQYTLFAQTNVTKENPATVTYISTDVDAEESTTDNKPAFKAPAEIMKTDNKAYGTKYPMLVSYDYGNVTTADTDKDKDALTYWTNGTAFNLVFGNYVDDCTITWIGSAPTLTYPGVAEAVDFIKLSAIKITDWYKYTTPSLINNFNGYAEKIEVALLTGTDYKRVNEYYTPSIEGEFVTGKDSEGNDIKEAVIKLTSNVTSSQGTDTPTKIQLTITDIYGGTVVKVFDPFTMKFQN